MAKSARWYQEEAINSLFDFFGKHRGYNPSTNLPQPENPLIALPTGTGKALVIAEFIRRAMEAVPGTRVCMATHVKELVKQNAEELLGIWPSAPVGIYSAGLHRYETDRPITFGGIGSLIGVARELGAIHILMVDEAHMISSAASSMYQKFITILQEINPYLRVVGLSATPWRTREGLLTNEGIFTHIVYNKTDFESFNRLVAEGYLAPLITKKTDTELDVSGVAISKGDYVQSQLEAAVDKDEITHAALSELCELGWNRRSWLIFATGKQHSEHCAEKLRDFGISAAAVHSGLPAKERDARIAAFKRGELRAMTGNNVFTTGFNHPPVDLIGMLRPTTSVGLWVQILGRGTRPCDGKQNCLVLDFAGNTRRLGPINDPYIPKQKKKGEPGEMPVKLCGICGCYNHTRAVVCEVCGNEFPVISKIERTADESEVMRSEIPETRWFRVDRIIYTMNYKPGKKPTLRVVYHSGLNQFSEFLAFEHEGFASKKARDWWRDRAGLVNDPPTTVFEALHRKDELAIPKQVRVWVNRQPYPEVLNYNFKMELENA